MGASPSRETSRCEEKGTQVCTFCREHSRWMQNKLLERTPKSHVVNLLGSLFLVGSYQTQHYFILIHVPLLATQKHEQPPAVRDQTYQQLRALAKTRSPLVEKPKRHLAKVHAWGELPALDVHLKFVDAVLCANVPGTWLALGVTQALGCCCSQCATILAPSKASRMIWHLLRVENAVIRHDAAHDLTDKWQRRRPVVVTGSSFPCLEDIQYIKIRRIVPVTCPGEGLSNAR